jgi:hypothetical protein
MRMYVIMLTMLRFPGASALLIFYVPEFINDETEEQILDQRQVQNAPKSK